MSDKLKQLNERFNEAAHQDLIWRGRRDIDQDDIEERKDELLSNLLRWAVLDPDEVLPSRD